MSPHLLEASSRRGEITAEQGDESRNAKRFDLVRARRPSAAVHFGERLRHESLVVVCFRVRNTSPFDSRLTAIGFELPGDLTGFTLISPTDSEFQVIEDVANVPGLPGVTLDFALTTGRTFGGGRPNSGLAPGSTLTTFCISGPFPPDVPLERLLDRGVLRAQWAPMVSWATWRSGRTGRSNGVSAGEGGSVSGRLHLVSGQGGG